MGSPVDLPHREERVAAVQALARAVSQLVDSGACRELLSGEVAVWAHEGNRCVTVCVCVCVWGGG